MHAEEHSKYFFLVQMVNFCERKFEVLLAKNGWTPWMKLTENCILNIHELYIYELLKFVFRSVYKLHGDREVNLNNFIE